MSALVSGRIRFPASLSPSKAGADVSEIHFLSRFENATNVSMQKIETLFQATKRILFNDK